MSLILSVHNWLVPEKDIIVDTKQRFYQIFYVKTIECELGGDLGFFYMFTKNRES